MKIRQATKLGYIEVHPGGCSTIRSQVPRQGEEE